MSSVRREAAILLTTTAVLAMLLGTATVPAALAAPDSPSTDGVAPMFLRLKAGTFDPLVNGVDWVPAPFRLAAVDPYGDEYIVQFSGLVMAGQREQMVRLGAAYHSYLPDNAFLVSASASVIKAVKALPFVRVVVPYQPFFRIDADLLSSAWATAPNQGVVKVENFGDPGRVNSFVVARGGSFMQQDGAVSTVSIPRSLLPALASLPTVARITPWVPRELDNYLSSVIQGARQVPDGVYNPASLRLWSYNPTSGQFEGNTGAGITVAVSDTGLDTTHPTFSGKIVFFDPMGGPYADTFGHGTHTSGTVLGNGLYRANDTLLAPAGMFAGIAPGAGLIHENIFASGSSNTLAALDNARYGASVSSGSWANGGGYGSDSRQYDGFARDSWPDTTNVSSLGQQSVLYFFSAGNAGGSRTIGNPAEGKNVVAVGATGDNKNLSWNSMAGFSSRGTADDGRIKPDLVAPGVDVMSAYCPTCSMGVSNAVGTSYGEQSGTSMSCPGAAGAAAVAYGYYRDLVGHLPPADMIKAILINGVDEMDNYPVLGPDQGFGRLNLSTSLFTLPTRQQIWKERPASLSTGEEVVYTYPIPDALQPFVVTLAWLDEPGDTGASTELVNDLDLWVVGPSGEIYRGNAMDQDGNSQANGATDTKNTVEKVKITAPARGYYEVHVKGSSVPVGPQDFSLAIRGNVATDWYDILMEKVETNATNPIDGDVVTFNASVWNRGTQFVNSSSVTLEAQTPAGTSPVATVFVPSIAPGEKFVVQQTWTTVRGNIKFTARVAPPGAIVEFSTTNNEANKSFFVRGYGYAMQTDGADLYEVNPGTTVSIAFNVTQTGNVADNITAFVVSDNSAMPSFLDYVRVAVNPGQSKQFHLTIVVPPSAKAGDHVGLTVTTRSLADARYSTIFQTEVRVNHLYGFSYAMTPDNVAMAPTQGAQATITLENHGNGVDTLVLSTLVGSVPEGWGFTFDPPSVTLNDNESATVAVHVLSPDRADAGARYEVGVRAASDGAAPQQLNFSMRVIQIYAWTAAAVGPSDEVQAGDAVEIPIEATNLGNGVDNITIDLTTPPGWQAALSRSRLVLLPYGSLGATATVRVDRWALAGSYSMTFKFGGERNYTRQTITVQVAQDYELDVEGPGYTIQMGQGEVNTFEVTVINNGNGPAHVTPYLLPPEGVTMIPIVPGALLQRNETAKFTFQVIVARDAPVDLHNFTVDIRTGPEDAITVPLGMYINVHQVVETPPPGTGNSGANDQGLMNGLIAVIAVLAMAMPIGLLYLRRQAAKRAPAPEVIVQTHEDANAGEYDPTKGYEAADAGAVLAQGPPKRAPRGGASAQAASAMAIVGVCKNCGGGVMDLHTGMGRCVSCGVEQILRPGKR